MKRKKIMKKSADEKKNLAEKRLKKKTDYQTALAEAQDILMEVAVKMHETLGCHTVDYYYEAIIQTLRMAKHQRARNPWNAYLRAEVKRRYPLRKVTKLAAEISANWRAMSKDNKKTITEESMELLEEYHINKRTGVNNMPINAFHNTHTTLKSISNELTVLSARTGCYSLLMSVRSDTDHYSCPYVYMSDDCIGDYFQLALQQAPTDITTHLEAYCLSGVTGEAAQVNVPRMLYVNFEENIMAKYGVVCEGWPLQEFCSPGDIGLHTEVLNSAWKLRTAKFQKMSKAEFEQWDKDRFQQKLNHCTNSTAPQSPLEGSSSANPTSSPPAMTEVPASAPLTIEITSPPLGTLVNIISGIGGKEVVGKKKARKTRSDKGKKQGPKASQATNADAPAA
ncbi:uncharacterized protein EDB93DRAFT_1076728 [Suillus bovinus]|uniref:uncharacterized protein n=1 Tax=Suillus bovinus TaxID=48563 RepID=UPI001B85B85E|nr:uncharacterized protein EDB93DRAFT_1076728 [Suillus bovinus]KAG2158625.1 hypothetical protein EDB93DRAFT_1076728 [Suillus bovinus]